MLNPHPGAPTARSRTAWDVVEEACIGGITCELTLTTRAHVKTRVYIANGLVYFAEHEGDDELAARLVTAGAIGHDQLRRGSIRLDGGEHLAWLFQRDTTIDRAAVEGTVETITEQTLGSGLDPRSGGCRGRRSAGDRRHRGSDGGQHGFDAGRPAAREDGRRVNCHVQRGRRPGIHHRQWPPFGATAPDRADPAPRLNQACAGRRRTT